MNRSIIAAAVLLLTLTGWATTKEVKISAEPIKRPALVTPDVTKLKMRNVKWIVVTRKNIDKVMADLEKNGDKVVLFALTTKGYEAVSLNVADLRKLVMQQQAIIASYKDYYK